uniref:Uncharacterized protein n=1 Tax=Arundo donax TaxID=35708 RepID=A0A0A9FD47_ARUDO
MSLSNRAHEHHLLCRIRREKSASPRAAFMCKKASTIDLRRS